MNWKKEYKPLIIIIIIFLICFYLPIGNSRFNNAILEALYLIKSYAREHVLLCLIPAFLIAGAISVFISQASVMKYLGAKANKILAYSVASVSGTILAVCSCTVLPLFAGIYRKGAGLGPAIAFLYSGPAINVLAIILTARVLGLGLGIARAIGAILFSIIIGLIMNFIFHKEELAKAQTQLDISEIESTRPLWKNILYFASMVFILVFANWGKTNDTNGLWYFIYSIKWFITGFFALALAFILVLWFKIKWWKMLLIIIPIIIFSFLFPNMPLLSFSIGIIGLSILISNNDDETGKWFESAWGLTKQILPLLLGGILIAGILLGRPNNEGLIPSKWIYYLLGGNSIWSNLFASIAGAFMYFATLTEVPILQGLIGNGMGKGPALALLLSGPALSLPNMLVIRSIMGSKKTIVFVSLVIIMSTLSGLTYGIFFD